MIQSIAGDSITDISRRCGDEAGLRVNLPLGDRARGERIVDCTLVDIPAQSILAYHLASEKRAEISADKCLCGYGGGKGGRSRLAESLVDTKDKGLAGLLINARYVQGAASGPSILITTEIRTFYPIAIIEVVIGVECAVAIELEEVAVKAVRSGFADDVDDIAAAPTVLSGEGIGLNLEFLNAFDRGHVDDAAPVLRRVPGSVQKKGSRAEVSATEVEERDILVGTP